MLHMIYTSPLNRRRAIWPNNYEQSSVFDCAFSSQSWACTEAESEQRIVSIDRPAITRKKNKMYWSMTSSQNGGLVCLAAQWTPAGRLPLLGARLSDTTLISGRLQMQQQWFER